MAEVTRRIGFSSNGSRIIGEYTFVYDELVFPDWDPFDPEDTSGPDENDLPLTGDFLLWVEGPGSWHVVLYRQQGQSRNPWREATLSETDGIQVFNVNNGPVTSTSDLRGADATRIA
jgi:hypothetical protein